MVWFKTKSQESGQGSLGFPFGLVTPLLGDTKSSWFFEPYL